MSSDSTLKITIHRHTLNIEYTTTNPFVRFIFLSYTKRQSVTLKFVGIKASNTITKLHTSEVNQINKCIYLI